MMTAWQALRRVGVRRRATTKWLSCKRTCAQRRQQRGQQSAPEQLPRVSGRAWECREGGGEGERGTCLQGHKHGKQAKQVSGGVWALCMVLVRAIVRWVFIFLEEGGGGLYQAGIGAARCCVCIKILCGSAVCAMAPPQLQHALFIPCSRFALTNCSRPGEGGRRARCHQIHAQDAGS
jgi:hypothetical protein